MHHFNQIIISVFYQESFYMLKLFIDNRAVSFTVTLSNIKVERHKDYMSHQHHSLTSSLPFSPIDLILPHIQWWIYMYILHRQHPFNNIMCGIISLNTKFNHETALFVAAMSSPPPTNKTYCKRIENVRFYKKKGKVVCWSITNYKLMIN